MRHGGLRGRRAGRVRRGAVPCGPQLAAKGAHGVATHGKRAVEKVAVEQGVHGRVQQRPRVVAPHAGGAVLACKQLQRDAFAEARVASAEAVQGGREGVVKRWLLAVRGRRGAVARVAAEQRLPREGRALVVQRGRLRLHREWIA